ncbi:protein-L-isoaspartate(D-aspartate) O-methyltransferase [Candidatus Micrarchaeota archaeon]|nr:protein-L-isoaspartate(D-aspartate) O-methyltransferase [Candidatus Micrarchaeota archaeon]
MSDEGLLKMVNSLKQIGYLRSKQVEKAFLAVDRSFFIPKDAEMFAYYDQPIPIGQNQTISAPTVVAFMLESLELKKGFRILEIGTGSGYNSALISYLIGKKGKLITIEFYEELTNLAKLNIENLKKSNSKLNFDNITFITGDGSLGYEKEAPYDRIIVTAAMPQLTEVHPLIQQLKEDGKLIAPVGNSYFQDLILYDKKTNLFKKLLPVMFVPLQGKYGFK